MTTTKTTATLVEQDSRPVDYGMLAAEAIVDHPKHGRLYITQLFGGVRSLSGGMPRWTHGMVCRLQPGDTLAALKRSWNDGMTHRDAILSGCDSDRPILEWDGYHIDRIAQSVGL